MLSLYDDFSNIPKGYYGIKINVDELFDNERALHNCNLFIQKHFTAGCKKGVLDITENYTNEYELRGKQVHTVSLYLLGLHLMKLFNKTLKEKIEFLIPSKDKWYDYYYTWYLTCLYHDIASVIERNKEFLSETEEIAKTQLYDEDKNLFRFDRDIILKYQKYRSNKGRVDHGVFGGISFFNRIKASFEKETFGHDWQAEPVYNKHNLKWRLEHIKHFAYIADAICCHNIWLAVDSAAKKEYQEKGLDELCVENHTDKLSFREYPLQFILCLLDTIEPVKRFSDMKPKDVLENISIKSTGTTITIEWTKSIKNNKNFFRWLDSICSLDEWMKLNVKSCECNGETCKIKIMID